MFLANNPKCNTAVNTVELRHMTKSHVSTSLKKLEKNGYIEGHYAGNNRKTIRLSLCGKSDGIVKEGRKAINSFTKMLFSGITKEETAEFWRLVSQMQKIYMNI